jgi:Flp pilus assembly protein TadD
VVQTSSNSEDWPGFQREMEQSDIAMKDVILRVVASNSDPEAREMEIKKMGQAYTEIADRILPRLRKSDITFNADKTGRSDEQISALAISNPDILTAEELLYAGTLTTDLNTQQTIYTSAERIYPQDYRVANNLGVVKFQLGDKDAAMRQFEKANQLQADNTIVANNMGAVYMTRGDRAKATSSYAAAKGAGSEVGENMAAVDILNGKYSSAVSNCGGANTFNCALAKLLNGDQNGAMSTLEASPDKDTAIGHYLKAVISARKNDATGVVSNLQASVSKDNAMRAMAKDDREFIKWFNNGDFKAVVE